MDDVKPCPFCGSEPVVETHALVQWVRCSNEDCAIVDEPGNSVQLIPVEWNRRTPQDSRGEPDGWVHAEIATEVGDGQSVLVHATRERAAKDFDLFDPEGELVEMGSPEHCIPVYFGTPEGRHSEGGDE